MGGTGKLVVTGGAGFLGRRIIALAGPRWGQMISVDLAPFPAQIAGVTIRSVIADLTVAGARFLPR